MSPHQSAEMANTLQQFGMVFISPLRHCGGLWIMYLSTASRMTGSLSKSLPASLSNVSAGLAGSRIGIWDVVGISIVMVPWFMLQILSGRVNSCALRIVILTNSNNQVS